MSDHPFFKYLLPIALMSFIVFGVFGLVLTGGQLTGFSIFNDSSNQTTNETLTPTINFTQEQIELISDLGDELIFETNLTNTTIINSTLNNSSPQNWNGSLNDSEIISEIEEPGDNVQDELDEKASSSTEQILTTNETINETTTIETQEPIKSIKPIRKIVPKDEEGRTFGIQAVEEITFKELNNSIYYVSDYNSADLLNLTWNFFSCSPAPHIINTCYLNSAGDVFCTGEISYLLNWITFPIGSDSYKNLYSFFVGCGGVSPEYSAIFYITEHFTNFDIKPFLNDDLVTKQLNLSWTCSANDCKGETGGTLFVFNGSDESDFLFDPDLTNYSDGYDCYTNYCMVDVTEYIGEQQFGVSLINDSFIMNFASVKTYELDEDDEDWDGYNTETPGTSLYDCNDSNASIYFGAKNYFYSLLNLSTDWDCDGLTGWAEKDDNDITLDIGIWNYSKGTITDFDKCTNPNICNNSDGDFIFNNSDGRIVFNGSIDLNDKDFSAVEIAHNYISVSDELLKNRPADLTFINTSYFHKAHFLVYHNGAIMDIDSDDILLDEDNISFRVSNFSSYSLGNSSQLSVSFEPDAGFEAYSNVKFAANYSTVIDNASINAGTTPVPDEFLNNGSCTLNISFRNSLGSYEPINTTNMIYNGSAYVVTPGIKVFNRSGVYAYNVSCTSFYGNISSYEKDIAVNPDITPPPEPILYPQALLHPGVDFILDKNTTVCGYFQGENFYGDVKNITIINLESGSDFTINTTPDNATGVSIDLGDVLTKSFDSSASGEAPNIIFVEWTQEMQDIITSTRFLSFGNHNRTCYVRYDINDSTRIGDELKIVLEENISEDVPIGTNVFIHDSKKPSGWFNKTSPKLFDGLNRISVWGTDYSGNQGSAAEDYIYYSYAGGVLPVPIIWENIPSLITDDNATFQIYGVVDMPISSDLNLTVIAKEGYNFNSKVHNNSNNSLFEKTSFSRNLTINQSRGLGNDTFAVNGRYVSEEYFEITSDNRTYFEYYNITNSTYIDSLNISIIKCEPSLEVSLLAGDVINVYNNSYPNGWFNISINVSELLHRNKNNELYLFAENALVQGPNSKSYFITYSAFSSELRLENLSDQVDFTNTPDMNLTWDVTDFLGIDHYKIAFATNFNGVDLTWVDLGNLSDTGNVTNYFFLQGTNDSQMELFGFNFLTSNVYYGYVRIVPKIGDTLDYKVSDGVLFIDATPPIAHNVTINDGDEWTKYISHLYIDLYFEDPHSAIINYEYALGKTKYPHADFDFFVNRTYTYDSASSFQVEPLLHNNDTVYLSARAQNGNVEGTYNGSWSVWKSSLTPIKIDIEDPYGGSLIYDPSGPSDSQIYISGNLGHDDLSNISHGLLRQSKALMEGGICNAEYSAYTTYERFSPSSNNSFNKWASLESGYCYKFKLLVYDKAGNFAEYKSPLTFTNETGGIIPIHVDGTAPSKPVVTNPPAFITYTTDGSSFQVAWDASSDNESGISHYIVKLIGGLHNNISLNATNGDYYPEDFITPSYYPTSLTLTDLSLVEGYKYYAEVIAVNGEGKPSEPGYSANGRIYFDTAVPDPITIVSINNATSEPYLVTDDTNVTINFTGEESMDCKLMFDDYDYLAHTVLTENVDYVNCTNSLTTNYYCDVNTAGKLDSFGTNATTGQGVFDWSISCMDSDGHTQTYLDNTDFSFEVNYPEEPVVENVFLSVYSGYVNLPIGSSAEIYFNNPKSSINTYNLSSVYNSGIDEVEISINNYTINMSHVEGGYTMFNIGNNLFYIMLIDSSNLGFVMYNKELYAKQTEIVNCYAEISDNDTLEDLTSLNISLYYNNKYLSPSAPIATVFYDPYLSGIKKELYYASFNVSDSVRRDELICNVTIKDLSNNSDDDSTNATILNSKPDPMSPPSAELILHDSESVSWNKGTDDDGDSLVYYLEINSTEVPVPRLNFSYSISKLLNKSSNILSVDVFDNKIVYLMNRSTQSDIFLYYLDTDSEIQLTASGLVNESYPRITANYVVYADSTNDDLRFIDISSSTDRLIYNNFTGTNLNFDVFGEYVAYYDNDNDEIVFYDLFAKTVNTTIEEITSTPLIALSDSLIVFANSTNVLAYDLDLNAYTFEESITVSNNYFDLYHDKLIYYDGSDNILRNLNPTSSSTFGATDGVASIYGDKIILSGSPANIYEVSNRTNSYSLPNLNGAIIYKDYIVGINASTDSQIVVLKDVSPITQRYSTIKDYSYIINTSNSPDYNFTESYSLRIKTCDSSLESNSCSYSDSLSVKVDNLPPTVNILYPYDDQSVSGEIQLRVDVNDITYDNSDLRGNYTLTYDNGSIFSNSSLPYPDFVKNLDFRSLEKTNKTYNMTLVVNVWDPNDNFANDSIDIIINPNAPSFDFNITNNYNDAEYVNDIDLDITPVASNVWNSSFKITGPIDDPSESIVRYKSAQSTVGVEAHPYPLSLASRSWPEGKYELFFEGSNPEINYSNETKYIYVDKIAPEIEVSPSANALNVFANESLNFSISFADVSIVNSTVEYLASNKSMKTDLISYEVKDDWNVSKEFTLTIDETVNFAEFINSTYNVTVNLTDAMDRSTNKTYTYIVANNPPQIKDTLVIVPEAKEDTNISINFSNNFKDVNGNNLSVNCSGTAGLTNTPVFVSNIFNETAFFNFTTDFFGEINVSCYATDKYNNDSSRLNFTINVTDVPDAPEFNQSFTNITFGEDKFNVTNLSTVVIDVDTLPNFTSSFIYEGNPSLISVNLTNNILNITGEPNASGLTNITIKICDAVDIDKCTNETINVSVTPINDAPIVSNIIIKSDSDDPSYGHTGLINISWDAYDNETANELLNSSVELFNGSNWSIIMTSRLNVTNVTEYPVVFNGTYTIRVNVTDGLLSVDSLNSSEFIVDPIAPNISLISPLNNQVINTTSIEFNTSENANCGINVSGTINNDVGYNRSHSFSIPSLTEGDYGLIIKCKDVVGNNMVSPFNGGFHYSTDPLYNFSSSLSGNILYFNQNLTITLNAFSLLDTVEFDINITNSSGLYELLTESNFTSNITSTNHNIISNNISLPIGNYTIALIKMNNTLDNITNENIGSVNVFAPIIQRVTVS